MALHYLHVEAVNLDHFVYDTHDISTIRGGSFLLLDAIKGLADAPAFANRLQPIATAASQGLFQIKNAAETDSLPKEILAHLHKKTDGHATFLAAVASDASDIFPVVLDKLQAEIRRQQWRMPTVLVPDFTPTADECFLDGWRPGVVPYRVDEAVRDARISAATAFRREKGREIKHQLFFHLLRDKKYEDNLCARDLGELANDRDKGILNGKIAYIHIDGNSFGRIRRKRCTTPVLRSEFDRVFQQDCRESFLRSLLRRADTEADYKTWDSEGKEALRIEVLLWGGDEMTLVVPAWKGWQLLELYYSHANSLSFEGAALSQRAAIVFAHHNAPLLQIREIANGLLGQTRENIKTGLEEALTKDPTFAGLGLDEKAQKEKVACISDHAYGNALRYLVLESFDMLAGSLPTFLQNYYKGIAHGELLIYAHELASLRQTLGTLRAGVARSRVLAIVKALQAEKTEQIPHLVQQLVDFTEPALRPKVDAAAEALAGKRPARWYLLADLWDYIPEWSI